MVFIFLCSFVWSVCASLYGIVHQDSSRISTGLCNWILGMNLGLKRILAQKVLNKWVSHMNFSLSYKIPCKSPARLSVEFCEKYLN